MKLTPKQLKFADEYVKTGNATQSAIKAGYSKRTAKQMGTENLSKPYIKAYIDKKLAEIESHKIADAKEVLQYLTRIMRGEETETVVTPTGDKIEVELNAKTRMSAAKEIMKRYPNDNPMIKAQLRKIEAEVALKEHERKQLEEQTNSRTTIVINDEWEDDDGKND